MVARPVVTLLYLIYHRLSVVVFVYYFARRLVSRCAVLTLMLSFRLISPRHTLARIARIIYTALVASVCRILLCPPSLSVPSLCIMELCVALYRALCKAG